jgi:GGDEF domain-containing protein
MSFEIEALVVIQLVALAITVQHRIWERFLKIRVAAMVAHMEDPASGMLTGDAIALRLKPEFEWAHRKNKPLAILRIDAEGDHVDPDDIARCLASAIRRYENVFRLDDSEFAVALWDANQTVAATAAARFCSELALFGATRISLGMSIVGPEDNDVSLMVAHAELSMRQLKFAAPVNDSSAVAEAA